ncbi:MAG: cysteine desulfurase family protein [Patescibacteria group bacterium]|nr:cysteine desulfurase family protein [Patescibacteria group bacterium]
MKRIYFDHAATTPVDKKVMKAMKPYFCDVFGNPSSLHSFGQEAMKAVDEARNKVAKFLNCDREEVIFTSGATEANNLAIRGVLKSEIRNQKSGTDNKLHVITTAFEHPAVLETVKDLEKSGLIEASYVMPGADGIVKTEDIEKEIRDNTILVSVMYVNNEIGTIQPIKEISEVIKRMNEGRPNKILFHIDAVQAALYCEMKVGELGVDLLAMSGHKIYGPKGIGVLYVKKSVKLKPIQTGGHHEFGLRAGTLNTPLIAGMGRAVELIKKRNTKKVAESRDYLWTKLQRNISGIKLNGEMVRRVPSNLNVSILGVEGEALLLGLDMEGIAISTGSACSSGSLEPSHVLMAIGLSHEEAHGSLRITLGEENNESECDELIKKLTPLVERFRQMAPKTE